MVQDWIGAARWKRFAEESRPKRNFVSGNVGAQLCVSRKSKPNTHSASEDSRTRKMCQNVIDAILNSNVTSAFTLILPWLAAKSHLEHGFTKDSIFGKDDQMLLGSDKKHLRLCQKRHLTEFHRYELVRKHFCYPPLKLDITSFGGFLSSLQLPRWHAGTFSLNFRVGHGIHARNGQFCHKWNMPCTHIWKDCFGHNVSFLVIATLWTGASVSFVLIGFVREANFEVIPLIVAVPGGVLVVGFF